MTGSVYGKLLWKNLHWIFGMSLIPMTTEWMGLNPYKNLPALFYGIILFMCAVSYNIVQSEVLKINGDHSQISKNVGNDLKGKNFYSCIRHLYCFCFLFSGHFISSIYCNRSDLGCAGQQTGKEHDEKGVNGNGKEL